MSVESSYKKFGPIFCMSLVFLKYISSPPFCCIFIKYHSLMVGSLERKDCPSQSEKSHVLRCCPHVGTCVSMYFTLTAGGAPVAGEQGSEKGRDEDQGKNLWENLALQLFYPEVRRSVQILSVFLLFITLSGNVGGSIEGTKYRKRNSQK